MSGKAGCLHECASARVSLRDHYRVTGLFKVREGGLARTAQALAPAVQHPQANRPIQILSHRGAQCLYSQSQAHPPSHPCPYPLQGPPSFAQAAKPSSALPQPSASLLVAAV